MWPFRKPAHTEVRYVAATRAENKLAHRKHVDRQLELAVATCHLTPEQRSSALSRAVRGEVTVVASNYARKENKKQARKK